MPTSPGAGGTTTGSGGGSHSPGGSLNSAGGSLSPPDDTPPDRPVLICDYLSPHRPGLTELCDAQFGALCEASPDAYLKPLVTSDDEKFGWDVAMFDDTMVVSAFDATRVTESDEGDEALAWQAGTAHVFVREEGQWVWQAMLEPWDGHTGFGFSLAIWDDTIAVGAYSGNQDDSVYVYAREGTRWEEQARFRQPAGDNDGFGYSLALEQDTLVVGDKYEDSASAGVDGDETDNSAPNAGAAYVFTRTGDEWVQTAYLKASSPDADDRFGYSVAISQDTVVVGASGEDSVATGVNGEENDNSGSGRGAAYVFRRFADTWEQEAYLKPEVHHDGEAFGKRVSISGDTIAIASSDSSSAAGVNGDPHDESAPGSGAVYVFDRQGGTWAQSAYVKASNSEAGDYFGRDIALSGNELVVGAWGEQSDAAGVNGDPHNNDADDRGAAYVFRRDGGVWAESVYLKPPDGEVYQNSSPFSQHPRWGRSVAISEQGLVVSSPYPEPVLQGIGTTGTYFSRTGAADVFERDGETWSVASSLNSSAAPLATARGRSSLGGLGSKLAISGNTLVSSSDDAKSWHVYAKEESGWTPQAWLAPQGTDDILEFAPEGTIHGDRLAVQVQSGQLGSRKRVLFFERSGGTWSQGPVLESANNEEGDRFGDSIALGDNFLVVGAPDEDGGSTVINGDASDNTSSRSGAAYVFELVDGSWQQTAYLKPGTSIPYDEFGSKVVATENVIVVASETRIVTFVRGHGSWVEQQGLEIGRPIALSLSGDTLAVRIWGQGVHLYRWEDCQWSLEQHLSFDDPLGGIFSVSVSGDVLAIGHYFDTFEGATGAGSVSLWVRDARTSTWSQTADLGSPAPQKDDRFGWGVALDGGNLAIGAHGDDGTGLGLGVDVESHMGHGSGAVFVWSVANDAAFR